MATKGAQEKAHDAKAELRAKEKNLTELLGGLDAQERALEQQLKQVVEAKSQSVGGLLTVRELLGVSPMGVEAPAELPGKPKRPTRKPARKPKSGTRSKRR